ncbi:unnamed protein product [Camellia sinensis]
MKLTEGPWYDHWKGLRQEGKAKGEEQKGKTFVKGEFSGSASRRESPKQEDSTWDGRNFQPKFKKVCLEPKLEELYGTGAFSYLWSLPSPSNFCIDELEGQGQASS